MQIPLHTQRFIHIIGKIPMFRGLKPNEALEILKVCKPRTFSNLEQVCAHGTPSMEMFVLLAGKLAVTALDGTTLTHLTPITIVGEMGLITGQPRSATVIAEQQSSTFEISKLKFDVLMKKSPEIGFKIYRNIIFILSHRLDSNNSQLAECQRELSNLRTGLSDVPAV